MEPTGSFGQSLEEYLLTRCKKMESGCWHWTRSIRSDGYGQCGLKVDGKIRNIGAHRLSYQVFNGDIPPGAVVMHSCDNKLCVNPAHLRAGSHRENMWEASERSPKQYKYRQTTDLRDVQ